MLAVVYLVNRLPTKVINNSTPLEHLHNKKPDYTALRIFGCACWPHLRPYNNHKLPFYPNDVYFLGYSDIHKGYKCLEVSSGRIYISQDVIFDEEVFPFSTLHPNAGAHLKSGIHLIDPTLFASTTGQGVGQGDGQCTVNSPVHTNILPEHGIQGQNAARLHGEGLHSENDMVPQQGKDHLQDLR
jgi:hypothetical protein